MTSFFCLMLLCLGLYGPVTHAETGNDLKMLSSATLQRDAVTISGVVTDDRGETLIGATISVRETCVVVQQQSKGATPTFVGVGSDDASSSQGHSLLWSSDPGLLPSDPDVRRGQCPVRFTPFNIRSSLDRR